MLSPGDMSIVGTKLDEGKKPTKKQLMDAYFQYCITAVNLQKCEYPPYNEVLIDICDKITKVDDLIVEKGGRVAYPQIDYRSIAALKK